MEALQMAASCTFTPKTNITKSNAGNSHRTATTKATASSGGSKSESVFDRLYKDASMSVASSQRSPPPPTTTRWNASKQLLHQYSSTESRTSTAVNSRMEDLYEKEVRKARRRPKTDQQERRLRDRLWEERELQECTFRPKLDWGSKKSSKKSSLPVPKFQAPRSHLLSSKQTPSPAKLQQPRFPKEIIVIPPPPHDTKHRPWHTPRRQEKVSDFMMVSPLRDPFFVDEQDGRSRIIIGSAVASGSITVTQAGMEYGSI
jgi:hypothetical protein